jgi:PAS domain S-box-containing protein
MISILYVDDEPDLLDLAQIFLEQTGEFRVRTATSAEEMLADPGILSFDAILSDYQMPGMDGIAFLEAIRNLSSDLPFILFTGRGREEVVIEALNNGADFYIQKGGDPKAQFAELANKIRYAVERKRAERELQKKSDELNASYEQIAANEEELRQQLDELTVKQDALKISEEKFRAFTENVPDLTTISDIHGNYQYISPSIQRITGQNANALLGKNYTGVSTFFGIVREDEEILLASGRSAIGKPGEPVPVPPFRVRDSQGGTVFIEGTITYLPDVKGIQGLLFHGRDITDRIRADEEINRKNREIRLSYEQLTASEEELRGQYEELAVSEKRIRESEEKFRTLFEKIHEALIVYTGRRFTDCNQRALELFGFASKEEFLALMPKDIFPLVQPDGKDSVRCGETHFRKALQEGSDHFEWVHKKKDGSLFSADVLLSRFELDGKPSVLASIRDISDRKRAEEQLELLKISVDQSSDEVFWLDFSGTILYVNDAACRATGYSREELCSMKLFALDPDSPPEVWGASVAELRAKKTQSIQTRHQRKDGTLIDVEIVAIYVNKGDREYSFAFVRDITRRKQEEKQRLDNLAFLNALIEQNPTPMWISDDKGFLIRMNAACSRLLRSTEQELVGKYTIFQDNIVEQQGFMPLVRSVFEEGKAVQFSLIYDSSRLSAIPLKESVSIILDVTIFPVRNADGKITNVVIVLNDVSGRARAERILAESEERYRTLVDSSFDGIAIHQDGKIVFVNQTGVRMIGLSDPAGLIGKPAIDIIHPDDRALIAERIRISPEKSLELIHERFLRADGSTMHVDVATTPCTWQGRPATYVTFRDISIQKKAEEALRESEENYRSLIELAPVAIVVHRDGKNVYANPEAVRMIKAKAPGDIIGKDILTFISPDYHARTMGAVRKMSEEGVMLPPQEQRIVALDGEVLTVEIAAKPVNFQGLPSIMVLMRDITKRKKAEEALFDSRQMLQTVLDTIPQRVFWKDKNSVFLGCNKSLAQDAGLSDPSEIVGKTDYDNSFRETADLYRADDQQVMATGEGRINYEEPQVRPDGSTAWLRTSKVPLRDKEGNVVGVLGTYEDITEYKRSQEALRESEERFRNIVETTTEWIWEMDIEGRHTFSNPVIATILGYSIEEIRQMDLSDLIHPDDQAMVKDLLRSSILGKMGWHNIVVRWRDKNGSWHYLESNSIPVFGSNGTLTGFRGADRDITHRKIAEQALRESEEKYRLLVETTSDFIWEVDTEGKYTYISPKIRDMLGFEPEEIIGKTPFDLMTPADTSRIAGEFLDYVKREKPFSGLVNANLHKDGSTVIIETSAAPFFDRNGAFAGYRGIDRDVTERIKTEEALRESEATFRSVIEGAPEAIYFGADWNFQYLNPAALRLFGASSGEQLIGTPFMDRIHKKFHNAIRKRVLSLYDTHVAAPPLEEVYLKLDGSEVEVEVSSVPFRYKGKDGALVFIWDITDRKKAERARHESETEYRRILDTMQDAYIRSDAEGKIIMVNPSAARMFGYASPQELHGIPVATLYFNPAKRQEIATRLEKDERIADVVEMMLRMDSTTFWASINVQAIRGEGARLIGTEGIIRDITERKALEQAIQDTNKKLSLLNSITRHDVANQLTALQGYAQLAELSNPDPVVLDFLQKIEAATDMIARQIEFTKAYQELGEKTPAWFRLDEIVERTARHGVSFSNTCRAIEVFADPMIERVFYNLFDNAIRHGQHVTTIGIRCERAPDGLVIFVEDDGTGVVPEEKEKIFEKGFGKHTGFGLFLAREILATTGITIRETGYVGVGARFEITVPKEMWRIFPGGK